MDATAEAEAEAEAQGDQEDDEAGAHEGDSLHPSRMRGLAGCLAKMYSTHKVYVLSI